MGYFFFCQVWKWLKGIYSPIGFNSLSIIVKWYYFSINLFFLIYRPSFWHSSYNLKILFRAIWNVKLSEDGTFLGSLVFERLALLVCRNCKVFLQSAVIKQLHNQYFGVVVFCDFLNFVVRGDQVFLKRERQRQRHAQINDQFDWLNEEK